MGRPREFVDADVLEAAAHLFWKTGYQSTSIGEISKRTKVRPGSLYQAFGDKEQLFLQAVQYYCDNLGFGRAMRADPNLPVVEWLENIFTTIADRAENRPDAAPRGCLVLNTLLELSEVDDGIATSLRAYQDRFETLVRGHLLAAREAGAIRASCDVEALGDEIVVMLVGINAADRACADPKFIRSAAQIAIERLRAACAPSVTAMASAS